MQSMPFHLLQKANDIGNESRIIWGQFKLCFIADYNRRLRIHDPSVTSTLQMENTTDLDDARGGADSACSPSLS